MKQEVVQKASERPKRQVQNLTGIPTQMKMDFERRSGLSFDDVRVHYNSDKPAKIGALAYTQGMQVYIGQGQEKHLRHELGHVVQQKTMPVPATVMKHGIAINNDPRLEKQADQAIPFAPSSSIASHHAIYVPVLQGKFEGALEHKSDQEILEEIEEHYNVQSVIKNRLLKHIEASRQSDSTFSTVDGIVANFCFSLNRKSAPAAYSYGEKDHYTGFEEIYKPLRTLYDEKKEQGKRPTKREIFQCIARDFDKDAFAAIIEGENFITDLQSAIRCIYIEDHGKGPGADAFIEKTAIWPAAVENNNPERKYILLNSDIPPALRIDQFVLRHYTKGESQPAFSTIKSALSLEHQSVAALSGGHTGDIDWNKFGNIGNTFFILLVGENFVCKQKFIEHCKYYADIPMSSITTSMWVSSDWLDESHIMGTAYSGKAAEVHRMLVQEIFHRCYGGDVRNLASFQKLTAAKFVTLLGGLYNNFEVKVAGPVNVTEWKSVT